MPHADMDKDGRYQTPYFTGHDRIVMLGAIEEDSIKTLNFNSD
jgi:hypothetical protein